MVIVIVIIKVSHIEPIVTCVIPIVDAFDKAQTVNKLSSNFKLSTNLSSPGAGPSVLYKTRHHRFA
jgi:hypothetical protein